MTSLTGLECCANMKCAGASAIVSCLPATASRLPLAQVDVRRCGIGNAGAQLLLPELLCCAQLRGMMMGGNRFDTATIEDHIGWPRWLDVQDV
jgi:hypothetical protein